MSKVAHNEARGVLCRYPAVVPNKHMRQTSGNLSPESSFCSSACASALRGPCHPFRIRPLSDCCDSKAHLAARDEDANIRIQLVASWGLGTSRGKLSTL